MSHVYTAGMTLRTPSGTITSNNISATYEHDAHAEYDFVVPASTTDQQCQMAFPYANIKVISFSSTGACTIETNATDATGGDTVTLTSTVLAKMWTHDGKAGNLAANPLTANVATAYITNATLVSITVKVRVLYDATP
jgi:hypothetical protein